MKLHIDDKMTIGQLKDQFSIAFPYLKLEFFKKPHETGGISAKQDLLDPRTVLAATRTNHSEGDFFFQWNNNRGTTRIQLSECIWDFRSGLSKVRKGLVADCKHG